MFDDAKLQKIIQTTKYFNDKMLIFFILPTRLYNSVLNRGQPISRPRRISHVLHLLHNSNAH